MPCACTQVIDSLAAHSSFYSIGVNMGQTDSPGLTSRSPTKQPQADHGKEGAKKGRIISWIVLGICLATTYGIWQGSVGVVRTDTKDLFTVGAKEIADAMAKRMSDYHLVLRGGLGLFSVGTAVTREHWRRYVQALDLEHLRPGITGVGFTLRIDSRDLEKHLEQIRAEGFPAYSIRPSGERQEYHSIIFLEPFNARNQRAFGYDMFTEATRRLAMEHARDTGETSVSGRVTLVQETTEDVQYGCLMYLPVYRRDMPLNTVADRRAALQGYVGGLHPGSAGRSAGPFPRAALRRRVG